MSLEGAVSSSFSDYSETNSEATEVQSNHEICQRSGFKVKPDDLVQQWDGLWVKREFKEGRHPQDFVRSVLEVPRASLAPEQPDTFQELSLILATEDNAFLSLESRGFLTTEAKDQVSADDL